jgi:hypothetical protein
MIPTSLQSDRAGGIIVIRKGRKDSSFRIAVQNAIVRGGSRHAAQFKVSLSGCGNGSSLLDRSVQDASIGSLFGKRGCEPPQHIRPLTQKVMGRSLFALMFRTGSRKH